MFRIVEIAERDHSLSIRNGFLVMIKQDAEQFSVPLKDIDSLLLTQPAIRFSGYVTARLAAHNIPCIFCDETFVPAGILLSCRNDSSGTMKTMRSQLECSLPFYKRIWQRLVSEKIMGQSSVLRLWKQNHGLEILAQNVKSGDSGHAEAKAALFYWKNLDIFPKRSRTAMDENILFNYGYTILYSAFAREITAALLFPKIGIFHKHRNNPFPLASDLMEPFRPCVDHSIMTVLKNNTFSVENLLPLKKMLLQQLYQYRFVCNGKKISLFTAIRISVQSYKKALLEKNIKCLKIPAWKGFDSDVDYCCL